jgi:hypothetical protein
MSANDDLAWNAPLLALLRRSVDADVRSSDIASASSPRRWVPRCVAPHAGDRLVDVAPPT